MATFRPNMGSKEYWMERADAWDRKLLGKENKTIKNINNLYKSSFNEIHKELLSFFDKYAAENNMTLAEAQKVLEPIDMFEYQQKVAELREMYKDTQSQYILDEISRLTNRAQITRLEALLASINVELCKSSQGTQMSLTDMLTGVYTDVYDSTAKLLGGLPLTLPTGAIEHIVDYPWSGKMFSDRIWDNKDNLLKFIKQELTAGLIRGDSTQKISKKLMKDLEVFYYQAERLVRTESNYTYNHAHAEVYKDCGLEKYEFLAAIDSRTSPQCRQHDSMVYLLKDAKVGTNYPPLHPNCRSTVIPYKDEWVTSRQDSLKL